MGQYHNDALDYVNSNTGGSYSQASDSLRHNLIATFLINADPLDSLEESDRSTIVAFQQDLATWEGLSLDALFDSLQLTTEQRTFMQKIYDTVEVAATNADSALTILTHLEDSIAMSSALADSERVLPFMQAAIAKYSIVYWSNVDPLPSFARHTAVSSDLPEWVRKDIKGMIMGAASGFVGGAITGALAGAFAGGVGALPGGAVGALWGAVGGAITGAIWSSAGWQ